MKILVDADACPVKEIIVREAKARALRVIMICDTAHEIRDGYSETVTVDKGADSADLKLISLGEAGDLVITQDYGVAAMALGKGMKALNQNGLIYTADNIDRLLFERFLGKKVRRSGGRTKNMKKRSAEDDAAFERSLRQLLKMEEENGSDQ
ncbi:MAG: YaiI/YqxD family protein [Oscillospiraceae bacterium]|nr:YaiI/YqxD family protein [Oscillospiraceae bacterium]